MQTKAAGRPVELNYGPDVLRVPLNVEVHPGLKRALAEAAERNDRRLADEVRDALSAHIGEET